MIGSWTKRLALLALPALVACGGAQQSTTETHETAATPAAGAGQPAAPAGEAAAPAGDAGAAPATSYEVAPVTDGGTISGKVTLGGAAPAAETVEVTKDNAACGTEKKIEKVEAGADGGLKNAVVWIETIAKGKDWAAKDGMVDQKNCHYEPHVQAMPVGGTLEIVNSDPVLHNIHAYADGETLFNIAQPTQGQKTPKKVSKAGPVELKCDVHSWMQAWVFVAPHPYFAVTKDDGTYTIDQVPAGSYKVKFWHEALGSKDLDVAVTAAGSATADASFTAQ